jgi:hypothetical protein
MDIKKISIFALGLLSSATCIIGAKGAEVDLRPLVIPPLNNNNAQQVAAKDTYSLYKYLILYNLTIPEKIMELLKNPKNNVILISDDFINNYLENLTHGDLVTSIAIAEIIRLNKGKLPQNTYVIGIDIGRGEEGEFLDQLNKAEIKAKVYINFSWYVTPNINDQQNVDRLNKLTIARIAEIAENPNVKVFIANGNNEVSGLAFGAQCLPNVYPVAATNSKIGSGNTAKIADYSTILPIQVIAPGTIFGKSKSGFGKSESGFGKSIFGIFDVNGDKRPDFASKPLLTFLRPESIEATGTSFASPTTLAGVFMGYIFNIQGIEPSPEIKGIKSQVQLANQNKAKLCGPNGRLIEEPKGRG